MPVVNLESAWTELDITNGWLQNRGVATIECTDAVSPEQVTYGLLAPGEGVSYADWSIGTIFVRKSQTSSSAKALLVCNANATNELAAIQNNLFLQDDIAVLLDPVESALYTDASGTTPAVVGNPIVIQRNIARTTYTPVTFANGDFATDISNWQKGANVGTMEWVAGELQFVGGGYVGFDVANWVRPTTTSAPTGTALFGRTVRVSFDATWVSGGNLSCGVAGYVPVYTITAASNNGVKTRYVFEGINSFSNASNRVGVFGAVSGAVWKIDNVVIELYDALDAFQATTALCPTLRQTSSSNRRWLEAVDSDDALNLTFGVAPGTMYVGWFTPEGVEWTTESWGTTVNTVRQNRYNGGLIARNRAWTVAEKALIESYRARYLPTLGPELLPAGLFGANYATLLESFSMASASLDGNGYLVATGDGVAGLRFGKDLLPITNKQLFASAEFSGNSITGDTAMQFTSAIGAGYGATANRLSLTTPAQAPITMVKGVAIADGAADTFRFICSGINAGTVTVKSASVREIL